MTPKMGYVCVRLIISLGAIAFTILLLYRSFISLLTDVRKLTTSSRTEMDSCNSKMKKPNSTTK